MCSVVSCDNFGGRLWDLRDIFFISSSFFYFFFFSKKVSEPLLCQIELLMTPDRFAGPVRKQNKTAKKTNKHVFSFKKATALPHNIGGEEKTEIKNLTQR